MVERDETGRLLHQRKKVEDLEPDTAYVAKIKVLCFFKDYINIRVIFLVLWWLWCYWKKICFDLQARNEAGWSDFSREFQFYTRGSGEAKTEHVTSLICTATGETNNFKYENLEISYFWKSQWMNETLWFFHTEVEKFPTFSKFLHLRSCLKEDISIKVSISDSQPIERRVLESDEITISSLGCQHLKHLRIIFVLSVVVNILTRESSIHQLY